MSLKLFKRKTRDGSYIWHYRGTIAGHRCRGSTGTSDKTNAARIASEVESRHHERHLDGPQEVLTFPQAVSYYLKAEKPSKYLAKIIAHWGDAKVKEMTAGAIRQSAIDMYPDASGATRNRQVITPAQAVINHCAELELCPPIRIKRFKFEKKIKQPITVEWLDTFCAHARPMMAAFATFMFATGCRFNEARRLEWTDIDFQQRTILVRKTKNKRQRQPHMPTRLLVSLANLPRDEKPFPWSESSMRRFWDKDVAKAAEAVPSFVRLTCHSCRHGFATKLLRDGVDPKTAADLGGWDSVSLFIETYAHAMQKPSLTEGIFDTPVTRGDAAPQQKQEVTEK
jgi:integrase